MAKVGEELRLEQEHTLHLERGRKDLEAQIRDMSSRVEEAEQTALKGGKKIIQKLEGKVYHHFAHFHACCFLSKQVSIFTTRRCD